MKYQSELRPININPKPTYPVVRRINAHDHAILLDCIDHCKKIKDPLIKEPVGTRICCGTPMRVSKNPFSAGRSGLNGTAECTICHTWFDCLIPEREA